MKSTFNDIRMLVREVYDTIDVEVDDEATEKARDKHKTFPGITVARFAEPIYLYRVVDKNEWHDVAASGKVVGGSFAVKAERESGASWATNVDDVVSFGLKWQKLGRLKPPLRVLKIDGFDKVFSHLDPEIYDNKMSRKKCNTGLGCSVRDVSVVDLERVWIVGDDGSLTEDV